MRRELPHSGNCYGPTTYGARSRARQPAVSARVSVENGTGMHAIDQSKLEKKNANFSSENARWYLGLYSNDSDEVKYRKTSVTVKS